MQFLRWVVTRLSGRWASYSVILLAVVLSLPSLISPLVADDHVHALKWKASLESANTSEGACILDDYFAFPSRYPAVARQQAAQGVGWWTAPDFKLAFWRPLSAATHVIDHSLWPGNAVLMHVQTLLWFVAMLLALNALYRRLHVPVVATLALALYAWDDAHGAVLSFVANRNAFLAGLFGVCALIAHDKWRRDQWWPGAWMGPLLLAAGLLSAEMAVATIGFLIGYALFLDDGTLMRRLGRLAPYCVVLVAWQVVYSTRGYGAQGSGWYLHPLQSPLAYAAKLLERAPVLALGQLTPISSDFWMLYPVPVKILVFLLSVAVLVVVARIAWPRLAADPRARFWLFGAGLALAPISATMPMDRNLVFVGFGAAPALAIAFGSWVDNPPTSRWRRVAVASLAVFNLALAPLALPAKALSTFGANYTFAQADESIPRDPAITRKTLVVARVGSEASLAWSRPHREAEGIPNPATTRVLAVSFGEVTITRLDEVTLRVRPKDGFLASEVHQLTRGASQPFREGDTFELSNLKASVREVTADDRPQTVDFRFTAPLESSEWEWMRGQRLRLVRWTPPKLGESVTLSEAP